MWSIDACGSHFLSIGQHWCRTFEPLIKSGLIVALHIGFSDMWTNKYLFCLSKFWLGFLGLVLESTVQLCRMILYILNTTLFIEKHIMSIFHTSNFTNNMARSAGSMPYGDKSTIFFFQLTPLYVSSVWHQFCLRSSSAKALSCLRPLHILYLLPVFSFTWSFPQVTI